MTRSSSKANHASETILRDGMKFLPTPAEIKAICAEIQAGWTDDERERRCVVKSRPIVVNDPVTIGQ